MQKSLPLVFILMLMAVGCRSPEVNDDFTPDSVSFDPGTDPVLTPGAACPSDAPDLFNNSLSPYFGGDEEVRLEIAAFSYFRCGLCADLALVVQELFEENEDYRKYVRFYFHHFLLIGETGWQIHRQSVAAANQGEDHFWELHDYYYDDLRAGTLHSPAEVEAFAEDVLGLDMDVFEEDRQSDDTLGFLQWDMAQAQAQEVSGTPAVFVCGERFGTSVTLDKTAFAELIDGYLYE